MTTAEKDKTSGMKIFFNEFIEYNCPHTHKNEIIEYDYPELSGIKRKGHVFWRYIGPAKVIDKRNDKIQIVFPFPIKKSSPYILNEKNLLSVSWWMFKEVFDRVIKEGKISIIK